MDSVRTCVGCRLRDKRELLLRIVVQDSQYVLDETGGMPGRGAHVHRNMVCVNKAISGKKFARALRASDTIDASFLENRLKTIMENS